MTSIPAEAYHTLFLAAKSRRFEVCSFLLGNGAEVWAKNGRNNRRALHVAVLNDDAEITHLLLRHGANARVRNSSPGQLTPLNLLKSGELLRARSAFSEEDLLHTGRTAQICSAGSRLIQNTLPGCQINSLASAFKLDNPEAVEVWLTLQFCTPPAEGFELEMYSTPLHYAAAADSFQVIKRFASPRTTDERWNTNHLNSSASLPLHLACWYGYERIVRHLLPITDKVNFAGGIDVCTPLHLAVRSGSVSTVATLLESKDINLHLARGNGETAATMAAAHANTEILELLVKKDPSVLTASKVTSFAPLHSAARHLSLANVEFLMSNGDATASSPCTVCPDLLAAPLLFGIEFPFTTHLILAMATASTCDSVNTRLILRAMISSDIAGDSLRTIISLDRPQFLRLYLANADFSPRLWAEVAKSGMDLP